MKTIDFPYSGGLLNHYFPGGGGGGRLTSHETSWWFLPTQLKNMRTIKKGRFPQVIWDEHSKNVWNHHWKSTETYLGLFVHQNAGKKHMSEKRLSPDAPNELWLIESQWWFRGSMNAPIKWIEQTKKHKVWINCSSSWINTAIVAGDMLRFMVGTHYM